MLNRGLLLFTDISFFQSVAGTSDCPNLNVGPNCTQLLSDKSDICPYDIHAGIGVLPLLIGSSLIHQVRQVRAS